MKKLRRLSTVLLAALLAAIMIPLVASADTTPTIIHKVELKIDPLVVGTEVTAPNLYDQEPKPQVTIIKGECDIGPIITGDGIEMYPFWTTNLTHVFEGAVVQDGNYYAVLKLISNEGFVFSKSETTVFVNGTDDNIYKELHEGEENQIVIVVKIPAVVAKIGDKPYKSLQSAIGAAQEGDTVTMLSNVSYSTPIFVEKSITLDLAGKTITCDCSGTSISEPAAIIVKDDTNTTLTVRDSGKGGCIASNVDGIYVGLNDELCVEGGKIYSSAIDGCCVNLKNSLNIKGGELEGCNNGVNANYVNSRINISRGMIKVNKEAVHVSGGGTVTITGGRFINNEGRLLSTDETSNIDVYGGRFSSRVPDEYVPEGYYATNTEPYTVRKIMPDPSPSVDNVKIIIDKINALPAPKDVKVSDESSIKAAREAYDKLKSYQKKDSRLTEPLKKLENCETSLENAKAADEYDSAVAEAKAKKVTLKSVKAKKGRKAVVRWTRAKEVYGYQVYYKAKGVKAKKVTAAKTSTVKKTIKKLKAGKKYSVKVRPYTKVYHPETGKAVKVYGKWSKVKKAKAKN